MNVIFISEASKKNVGGHVMKDVVLNEIEKELSWKEKIIVKIFQKTFIKVCTIERIQLINKILK